MIGIDQVTGAEMQDGSNNNNNNNFSTELPLLHSIHRATVANVKEFGAFVKLDGYLRKGIVCVSFTY